MFNVNEYTTKEEFIQKATAAVRDIQQMTNRRTAEESARILWANIEYVQEWDWSDADQAQAIMDVARAISPILNGEWQAPAATEAEEVTEEITEATVKLGSGFSAFSAEVTKGNTFTKGGKNWQYFKVDEGRRQSEFAIDLDSRKLVRGKASPQFIEATLKAFNL